MIGGHAKAVSYVRWMGGNALVSASTDSALKVWDVARGCAADARTHAWQPTTTLTGEALRHALLSMYLFMQGSHFWHQSNQPVRTAGGPSEASGRSAYSQPGLCCRERNDDCYSYHRAFYVSFPHYKAIGSCGY